MTTVIRKRKLTTEQKNNIVKLAQTNPHMKQDEIARQFSVDRSTISKVLTESKKPKLVACETNEHKDDNVVTDEPVEQLTQDNYSRATRSRSSSSSQSYNQQIDVFGSSPLNITSTPYQSNYSPYSSYSSSLDSFQSINDHFDSLSFTNYFSYDDTIDEFKAIDALSVVKKYLEQQLNNKYTSSFIPNNQDISYIDSLVDRIQSSTDSQLGFY